MEKINLIKKYLRKYKYSYMMGMIILFLVDYIQMYIPQITGMITDGIKDGSMPHQKTVQMALLLVAIAFSLGLGRIGWRYFIVGTSRKIETDIRKQLFEKWVTLDLTYYNQNKTGNLMAYATNDINAIRMMLGIGVVILFDAVILTLMVILKMATYVDIQLTLFAILPMPFIAIGGTYFGKKVEERFESKQQAFAKLSDKVQESLSGIRVIKAFVQEYYDLKGFETISKENYTKNIHLTKLSAILNPLMNLLIGTSVLIAIGYGGYLTMISHITLGEFVALTNID